MIKRAAAVLNTSEQTQKVSGLLLIVHILRAVVFCLYLLFILSS